MFVERTDLLFQNPVRSISNREWRSIGSALGLKPLLHGSEVDFVDFDLCTVFVFEKRITFFAKRGSPEIAAQILRRLEYPAMEQIVFRARNERNLRAQITDFRAGIKGTIGAAVVSGDTVLFHPETVFERGSSPSSTAVGGDSLHFKIELGKISARVQNALKGHQGRADFLKLFKFQRPLREFTFVESVVTDNAWRIVARHGEEIFLLNRTGTQGSFKIRLDLDLSFESLAANGVDAICDLFQAKRQRVDVIHPFACDINALSLSRQLWHPHAFGLHNLRSELDREDSKLAQGPKVSASA